MRKNITQEFAGAIFGVSQPTVSRRWDPLLRSVIAQVLAEFVPDLDQVVGQGSVLVDGTICPTGHCRHLPDLYSAKAGYIVPPSKGFRLQRVFDAGLRPEPFPERAASLLPGLLTATPTGLTPASDDQLMISD